MSYNRLMGPRESLEIILCEYEDGKIFYQFNGMRGEPCQPREVHALLMRVAGALIQSADPEPALHPIAESFPHLLPEETPHV